MIHVDKPRLSDKDWLDVFARATTERRSLVNAFRVDPKPQVDAALYKQYKNFLLAIFNHKCAYCETVISSNQPGDVEHFRPKGRVVDDDFKPIRVKYRKWGEIDHPGYFWLAYDWDNLLPACIDCNRYRRHEKGGAGKADRFPVAEFRARLPGQERREQPLLVDPCRCDPADHFEFLGDGLIRAKTKMGEETIRIFGLNIREQLVADRRAMFSDTKRLFRDLVDAALLGDDPRVEEIRGRINDIWFGRKAYGAMGRLALEAMQAALRKRGGGFEFPLRGP